MSETSVGASKDAIRPVPGKLDEASAGFAGSSEKLSDAGKAMADVHNRLQDLVGSLIQAREILGEGVERYRGAHEKTDEARTTLAPVATGSKQLLPVAGVLGEVVGDTAKYAQALSEGGATLEVITLQLQGYVQELGSCATAASTVAGHCENSMAALSDAKTNVNNWLQVA